MAVTFKTPTQLAEEYLTHLKGLRPDINKDVTDSDWWIRSRVVGGTMSGLSADQLAISDDAFPQRSRREAVERHLQTYFDSGFKPETNALGYAMVTGEIGSEIDSGTEFNYVPTGNTYISTEAVTLAATAALIPIQSVGLGQAQNLLSGAQLTISNPPAGIDQTASASGDISGARNAETTEEAAARILDFIRKPISGGTVDDYKAYCAEADASVTSANILRYAFGFGTVAAVITAGTTDIDDAIDNDLPITVVPSPQLIDKVQAHLDEMVPVTDCPTVLGPVQIQIPVTVRVRFASGNKDTIVPGTNKTQGEFVAREITRAIYKTPAGGRQFGATGFVVASEMEEAIDIRLSASPFVVGSEYQFITDRKIDDLSASGPNRMILGTEVAVPGNITVLEF